MGKLSYIKHPQLILLHLDNKKIIKLSDKKYLKLLYFKKMKKKLNIDNPQTFNEKLQWLKLYDRNPQYTKMVDKYEVKEYVANKIGKEYIIPTIGIWDKFEDIDFSKLPKQFVLKCTHDSGGVFICKDKDTMDYEKAKEKLNQNLKKNFYDAGREWPYKNVKPRIIAEVYMEDKKNNDLFDYKFFCFSGKVGTILVCSNRNGNFKNTDFFDAEWNKMPFTRQNHSNNKKEIVRPQNLDKMLNIVEKLSKEIPFIRVDLYEIEGKIYFGEFTFYPSAGFEGFTPEEYDKILGDMLELPINKKEKNEK